MTNKLKNLEILGEVPLKISAVLGDTTVTIEELLTWTQGTVVEFNKKVGEPVHLCINQKPIAKGELILVNGDSIGITITEIIEN
jgi:flagellar motor switch protein FliN/FliY